MSFQAQNFPGISKATILETNRNSTEPKKEKNERILINYSILKLPQKKKFNPRKWCLRYNAKTIKSKITPTQAFVFDDQ